MGRPVYTYELSDSDLSWLVSSFQENNPQYLLIESSCLPIVFIKCGDSAVETNTFPVPLTEEPAKTGALRENK